MSNLVIVAIPSEDDYVHKISSEKVPHCTLLFLGDAAKVKNVAKIMDFVQHATTIQERGPFMLQVDHRGTLGEDDADVLFFKKDWSGKALEEFRSQLLKNDSIRVAYDNAEQHDGVWVPHLTLGYPGSPAREDDRDYPGIRWVDFDRIAVWFGDYEGPEFRLVEPDYNLAEVSMSTKTERGAEFISHYGVKGMRWGVRKERAVSTTVRTDQGVFRRRTRVATKGGFGAEAHTDAVVAAVQKQKLKKSGTDALSTQELRELSTRLQLEQQVQVLATGKGQKFVKKQLESEAESQAKRRIRKLAGAAPLLL